MAEGRGSAVILAAVVTVFMVVIFNGGVAEAATYIVGDRGGWTFSVSSWPQGKNFLAGDVLVFNYSPSVHNVVKMKGPGCTAPSGSKVYNSGGDRITLVKGQNYFICSVPGHCQGGGMIISVNAA